MSQYSNSGKGNRGYTGSGGQSRNDQGSSGPSCQIFFDPNGEPKELYDTLAEKQAREFSEKPLSSSQLRRYFGEIKDLYRQWESRCAGHEGEPDFAKNEYVTHIEPRFKMLRSKVFYAKKDKGKIPLQFADFLTECIKKVSNEKDFRKFVLHFEAVVGFMYGLGYIGK